MAGILAPPFGLVPVRAGSNGIAMKLTLAIWLAMLCFCGFAQGNKPAIPYDVLVQHQTLGTNIATLRARRQTVSKQSKDAASAALFQRESGKISSFQYDKALRAVNEDRDAKLGVIDRHIADLHLRRFEIERRYTMPASTGPNTVPKNKTLTPKKVESPKNTKS